MYKPWCIHGISIFPRSPCTPQPCHWRPPARGWCSQTGDVGFSQAAGKSGKTKREILSELTDIWLYLTHIWLKPSINIHNKKNPSYRFPIFENFRHRLVRYWAAAIYAIYAIYDLRCPGCPGPSWSIALTSVKSSLFRILRQISWRRKAAVDRSW